MNENQFKAAIVAIIPAIAAGGMMGAPEGILYAGLMGNGCTLNQFEIIRDFLTTNKIAVKSGDCLTITDKGRTLAAQIEMALSQ